MHPSQLRADISECDVLLACWLVIGSEWHSVSGCENYINMHDDVKVCSHLDSS